MKRLFCALFLLVVISGCATTSTSEKALTGKRSRATHVLEEQNAVETNKAKEAFERGLEAYRMGKDLEAMQDFSLALRHLRACDRQANTIMHAATQEMMQVASISAFRYVPDEAFKLFLLYQEMQNSYAALDYEKLRQLSDNFYRQASVVKDMTAQAKQQRLKALSEEVSSGMRTLQKEHAAAFEMYPKIYVVKPGDTLPGIAARHEIYNDSYMWPLIYKANRDQIKDPMVIYVGQDLKIPRDISVDEIIEARREAGAPDPEKIPSGAYVPKKGG